MWMLLALAQPVFALEIPHEVHQLDNGLEVVLMPDERLPKVVVSTWYDVGSYDDPQGRSGFAHLFEHLMFKGTPRVPEGEFDSRMEAAGGWNNASTADWRTNYFDVAPASALELLLWLEADRMTSLDITQDKLDVEREVVRNERRQNYEDRPYGMVWWELPKMLYPGHPLERSGIGTHEELAAADLDDVQAFYDTWYVPANAVLCVAGDFEVEPTLAFIERTFGTLPLREAPTRDWQALPTQPNTEPRVIFDDVTLPMGVMAWTGPPAYAAGDAERDVLANLLGGDGGRLVRRLVYEEQLALEVTVSQQSSRWDSLFFIDFRVAPDGDLAAVEAAIADELAALGGARPPTQAEVDRAVTQLVTSKLEGLQSVRARAEELQRYRMLTGRYDYLDDDIARYEAVAPAAVADEAAAIATGLAVQLHVLPRKEGT